MSHDQGKNSHSGNLCLKSEIKGHLVEEGGQEKRRPRTENGALGEHLSEREEQMGLGKKIWRRRYLGYRFTALTQG